MNLDWLENDPELRDYFERFLGEVAGDVAADAHLAHIALLAGLIGVGASAPFAEALGAALDDGLSAVEITETVYQAVPYAGMAKTREFIRIADQELAGRGVDLPLPGQSTTTPGNRFEAGKRVQGEIFGAGNIAAMHANAPADQKHIQRHLSANCFGDNYTRTGLSVADREIVTFAVLVAQGGCDPQAKAHAGANIAVGNSRRTLIDVVTVLLPWIGYPRTLNGLAAIDAVAPAEQ